MSTRPTALGRGLDALLPSQRLERAAAPAPAGPAQLPVEAIDPNPQQPRRVASGLLVRWLWRGRRVRGCSGEANDAAIRASREEREEKQFT